MFFLTSLLPRDTQPWSVVSNESRIKTVVAPLPLFDLSFWGCVSFRVWFDGFTRFLSDVLAS